MIRALLPPAPLVRNPRERTHARLGKWNLYVGGAGNRVPGYVNVDLFPVPGVNVAADAHALPFRDGTFSTAECDAVLEHVRDPHAVVRELVRVLAGGGTIHLVTPFCHPYHRYPEDYWRFTPAALELLAPDLRVIDGCWRTGPTATLLIVILEYTKLLLPWRPWRGAAHVAVGWLVAPLRYLDLLLFGRTGAERLGNHYSIWFEKPLNASAPTAMPPGNARKP